MALGQDILTRIINVHWGGGVYVTGSQWFFNNPSSNVWTNKNGKWKKTISTPHGGDFMPSAFPGSGVFANVGVDKNPIFVLGGLQDRLEAGPPFAARIMTSKNGSAWTMQTIGSHGEVYLVTWNETDKTLYAGMLDYSDPDKVIYDVVLSSSDGLNWSESERKPFEELYESLIEKHCSDRVKDIHNHKVPTSVFGYDEDKDILIAPDPVNMTWGISYPAGEDSQHGDRLKITRGPNNDNAGTFTMALPAGMARVWAVGYAAGIWQAAGDSGDDHGVIATSVDDGNVWEVTLTDVLGSSFANIAAGSKSSDSSE